jgi:PDZ domain-containing protein/tetratricopeptide repeat protein
MCLAAALLAGACAPPKALQRMVGRDPEEAIEIDADAFPAPEAPDPPAQLLFGTVILTNEPSWGLFLKRGQESGGALVLEVLPDTPASASGLQPGDVISWIDGIDVSNHEQLLVAFRDGDSPVHDMKVTKVDGTTADIEAELVPPDGFSLLNYLETKIATSPDPVTRYLLAEQVADDTRALELIRSVITEHPTFAEGHALLARRLMDKVEASSVGATAAEFAPSPDIDELTTAIDTAVELDPKAASIYRARSQIFLTLGDGASAEADASTALQMDDQSAETHYLLGTSRLTLGKYEDAIERLHLAVQLNPFEPKYYVNLALCYRSLGREPDAKSTLGAAKTLVSDPLIKQRLDELADAG